MMAFPTSVKAEAYARAGGQCECEREHLNINVPPHPGGRCPTHRSQENFYFVDKDTGVSGSEDGTVEDVEMLCTICYGMPR